MYYLINMYKLHGIYYYIYWLIYLACISVYSILYLDYRYIKLLLLEYDNLLCKRNWS